MAAQLEHLEVTHVGKRYQVVMHARMDTLADKAYAIFTDYARLPEINSAIIKAEPIAGAQGSDQRIHTQVQVCVMGFCRVFDQVQDMRKSPPEYLRADVIPRLSNLRYGKASWRIWDEAGTAKLIFEAVVEPDFWIPPLIGPWLIERKLASEAVGTANGIERLANAL
ncbi:MAG: SRPBCC family protein [Oceanococcus sp.]